MYGMATGIGFGVSEGVIYSADFYNGIASADAYVVRFVSCVALHATWSAAVGIMMYQGRAIFTLGLPWFMLLLFLVQVLLPAMVLHGLYDTCLKKEMNMMALLVAVASFGWLAALIESMRRSERETYEQAIAAANNEVPIVIAPAPPSAYG